MSRKKLDVELVRKVKQLIHLGFIHKDIASAAGIGKQTVGNISRKETHWDVEYEVDGKVWK